MKPTTIKTKETTPNTRKTIPIFVTLNFSESNTMATADKNEMILQKIPMNERFLFDFIGTRFLPKKNKQAKRILEREKTAPYILDNVAKTGKLLTGPIRFRS